MTFYPERKDKTVRRGGRWRTTEGDKKEEEGKRKKRTDPKRKKERKRKKGKERKRKEVFSFVISFVICFVICFLLHFASLPTTFTTFFIFSPLSFSPFF